MALLCSVAAAYGQVVDTSTLIGQLERSALRGERRSIRDLATLLGDPKLEARARGVLARLSSIPAEQIDFARASKQEVLDFYYDAAHTIQWSPLLRTYYTTPIEQQAVDYELVELDAYQLSDRSMHLRKYIAYVEQAVEYESTSDLRDLVEKIADLHLVEGQAYLIGLTEGKAGELIGSDLDVCLHYLDQLLLRPSVEVSEVLFEFEQRGYLRHGSLAHYLSQLCNVPFSPSWTASKHRLRYKVLVDSLGGLSRVREFGYRESMPFTRDHFRTTVDYFGRILATESAPGFVKHNALLDLIATQHPRALFYVSSQFLAAKRELPTPHSSTYYLYLLRKLTNLGVMVRDDAGQYVYDLDVLGGPTARFNFVRYWASHYEDYDYDEHRGAFVNRHDHSLQTENLERLFRLLNSENDGVALGAYERLTRADPLEVLQLVGKYKDLLRNTNPKVPPLKDGHLTQTAKLTAYCIRNRVAFQPSATLSRQLDSLLGQLAPKQRVALENRLIASVKLPDLTAVEYWAAVHQYELDAGYSVGRVLDYAYNAHWDELVNDDALLRLYLKKAVLFSRMEGIGVSDNYLRKFNDLDADITARLESLLISESDQHITRALKRLLRQDGDVEEGLSDLDDFLENPGRFAKEEIADLGKPTLEQMSELLWRLNEGATRKEKVLYKHYLEQTLDVSMVPDLMSLLIRRDESPAEVAKLLSQIYHFRWQKNEGNPPELWLAYWQQHSQSYMQWGEQFYDRTVARIDTSAKLTGADLNAVLRSPHYQPKHRAVVLESLPKLVSNRHLFMLRFEPALQWSERGILSGLTLGYRDLQDLDKLFPEVPPAELVSYVLAEAADFDAEDRGKLFNAIMRKPWIEELLDDEAFAERAEEVAEPLRTYLAESEFLSEYEEQNTSLNLARLQFIGQDAVERLRLSVELDVDPAAKLRIQEAILSRLAYEDLGAALALVPQLAEVNGKRTYNFLSRDFGLPVFDLSRKSVIDTFIARQARLTEADLYVTYLEEFGLEVRLPDGTLDYALVRDILEFDIVLPFIGGGGNRRDLYTYGTIKLLELTEGTRLGYHPKLNENQLFYSYSASRRAATWLEYLLAKGKVSPRGPKARPSFNATSSN